MNEIDLIKRIQKFLHYKILHIIQLISVIVSSIIFIFIVLFATIGYIFIRIKEYVMIAFLYAFIFLINTIILYFFYKWIINKNKCNVYYINDALITFVNRYNGQYLSLLGVMISLLIYIFKYHILNIVPWYILFDIDFYYYYYRNAKKQYYNGIGFKYEIINESLYIYKYANEHDVLIKKIDYTQ